jgi:threonine dehydratase
MLKLELFQPTRAFKVRGALNAMLTLPASARSRGVVTASAGNHGLGLAYAGAATGTAVTVVLPVDTSTARLDALRHLGGRAVLHGEDWNAADTHARSLAERDGRTLVHPFDDPAIMAGQGTLGLELLEQLPDLDAVVLSIGGGGLISGVASAIRQRRPEVRILGVETAGADCMARSLAADRVVELERFGSIASSLGTRQTTERPLAIVRNLVESVTVVDDREALAELVRLLDEDNLFVEPAAACTLAALASGAIPDLRGCRVAAVMCGGNVTLAQLLAWRERLGVSD